MLYNTIHHDIRNNAGLSLIDYCLLESIYQLSVNPNAPYKGWCNAAKGTFTYLATSRTITTRFKHLEAKGWLEFKDESRFLKRTTAKFFDEVMSYIIGVKKFHPPREETSPNKNTYKNNYKDKEDFDKRTNLQLPFDVVTSYNSIAAMYADNCQPAIDLVKQIYQIDATKEDVQKAMHTFSTVAVASYDKYRGIRSIEKLQNLFIDWIPKSIKYEQAQSEKASQKTDSQPQDLEAYILTHYREKDLEYMKKDGRFDKWQELLKENEFKLNNIAKGFKNKSFTPLFAFEFMFMSLGHMLSGSNPDRKFESFKRWYSKLSDYNKNQGDLRTLLKTRTA